MPRVSFTIPLVYNPGEWRISKQVIGPRGGKKWVCMIQDSATGGEYITHLEPGLYKETYWTNGWPTSREFEIDENGIVFEEYSDAGILSSPPNYGE